MATDFSALVQTIKTPADVEGAAREHIKKLILAEGDVVEEAMLLLAALVDAEEKLGIDPMELMTSALKGVAAGVTMVPAPARETLRQRIDEKYMGAGEVFAELCQKAAS